MSLLKDYLHKEWFAMRPTKMKKVNGSILLKLRKNSDGKYVKIADKTKVIVGPSESMSKSKKNVVDPESMIKSYGADAVRWFILSDSPPEKDIQWSNQGVNAALQISAENLQSMLCNKCKLWWKK